jgi:hypothetical protein
MLTRCKSAAISCISRHLATGYVLVRASLSSSAARSIFSDVAPNIENLATTLPSSLRSTIIPGSLTKSMRWYGPIRIESSLTPHPILWRHSVLFSVIFESSEALRAVISISNTTSSAMVSKQYTSLVWPCVRACANALTNQAKATVSSSTALVGSNQAPSVRSVFAVYLG